MVSSEPDMITSRAALTVIVWERRGTAFGQADNSAVIRPPEFL